MAVTKDDYERVYNELLGIDINWSKLPLEDLKALSVLFSNPELLVEKLDYKTEKEKKRAKRREKGIERVESLVLERLDKGKGPLAKLYNKFVIGDEDENDEYETIDDLREKKIIDVDIDISDPE